jgi:hypothetical protein
MTHRNKNEKIRSPLLQPLLIVLAGLIFALAGCKDGDPGKAGTNGTNGTNATNGTNGTDGAGYDQAIKNGSIIIYLNGKRPDGVAFKDTINYLFSSSNLNYSYVEPGDTYNIVRTRRFQGMDCLSVDNYVDINFEVDTEEGVNTYYINCKLVASVTTPDFQYFNLNDNYYNDDDVNITNPSFTAYSFDSPSSHLKYNFSFDVASNYNSTGYALNVSGKVDVTVYVDGND